MAHETEMLRKTLFTAVLSDCLDAAGYRHQALAPRIRPLDDALVRRAGGTYDKLFYSPTVLEGVRPDMRVYTEEVFGPVLSVLTFDTDEEAIAINNATEYGLSTGVITQSVERAMNFTAKLRTGIIHINDQTVADEPWVPFGRRGASGNGGRHGGVAN